MKRELLITDKQGKGVATVISNDPTFVMLMSDQQVVDISQQPEEIKQSIQNNPSDFDRHLKKVKKKSVK